jgi:hypothetical protein
VYQEVQVAEEHLILEEQVDLEQIIEAAVEAADIILIIMVVVAALV